MWPYNDIPSEMNQWGEIKQQQMIKCGTFHDKEWPCAWNFLLLSSSICYGCSSSSYNKKFWSSITTHLNLSSMNPFFSNDKYIFSALRYHHHHIMQVHDMQADRSLLVSKVMWSILGNIHPQQLLHTSPAGKFWFRVISAVLFPVSPKIKAMSVQA